MAYKGIPKAIRWMIAILAAVVAALLICHIVSEPKQSALPRLEVNGTQLVNADTGEPVVMRGVSLGWHNLWPRFYNSRAVETLHNDWGAPVIRLAIGATDHALADNPGAEHGWTAAPDFAWECATAAIDGAIETGCYVIVDWHSHTLELDGCKEFLGAIATKYAGVPNLIYELFNEPVSQEFEDAGTFGDLGDQAAMEDYWNTLKEYALQVIDTIVKADQGQPLILMGCPCWDQRIDLPASNPITGYKNLMYTVHFYAASHKQSLRDACDSALSKGTPVFISECASCENTGDGEMDSQSWEEWCTWAKSNGISMLTWSVSDKVETCSMLTPEASSEGPWSSDVVKPWGKVVQQWLKEE